MTIFPRPARDKHKGKHSKQEWRFLLIGEVLSTFCVAKLSNAAGTTAFQTFLFCIIWRLQKDAKGFHVSAEDYQM